MLFCQNWTLSQDSKLDKKRADLWLKYYGTMDRTLLEQECADVFEKAFKDFSRADEVHEPVKKALQIELRKIDDDLAA